MPNVFVSCVTDWDVAGGTDNWMDVYPAGYSIRDGGALPPNHFGGYIRLDDDAAGADRVLAELEQYTLELGRRFIAARRTGERAGRPPAR